MAFDPLHWALRDGEGLDRIGKGLPPRKEVEEFSGCLRMIGKMIGFLLLLFIGAGFFGVVIEIVKELRKVIPSILNVVTPYLVYAAFCLSLLGIGWLFFVFRQRKSTWYGLAEVGFAIAWGVHECIPSAADDSVSTIVQLSSLKLIGSVYLVVRGLDNATKNYRNTQEKKLREKELDFIVRRSLEQR